MAALTRLHHTPCGVLAAELRRTASAQAVHGAFLASRVAASRAFQKTHHALFRVQAAGLSFLATVNAAIRCCGAARMATGFLGYVHRSLLGVLAAVLPLLGALDAEVGDGRAAWMLTSLGRDVDHPLLHVLVAVLYVLAPRCTIPRDGGAAWVATRAVFAKRVHHARLGMLAAIFRLVALHAVSRHRCAAGMLTSLGFGVDHSLFGVLDTVLRLLGSFHAERRVRVAARVHTLPAYDVHHALVGVLAAVLRLFSSFHAELRLRCVDPN